MKISFHKNTTRLTIERSELPENMTQLGIALVVLSAWSITGDKTVDTETEIGFDYSPEIPTDQIRMACERLGIKSEPTLTEIYDRMGEIINSNRTWEEKYDLIFSEEISQKVPFDWYNPDMGYQDDVLAFVRAFDEYMKNNQP